MNGGRRLLELTVGVVLRFDGLDWTVEEIQAHLSRVIVRADGGEREIRTIRWLMQHPECRIVAAEADADRSSGTDSPGRQPPTW